MGETRTCMQSWFVWNRQGLWTQQLSCCLEIPIINKLNKFACGNLIQPLNSMFAEHCVMLVELNKVNNRMTLPLTHGDISH